MRDSDEVWGSAPEGRREGAGWDALGVSLPAHPAIALMARGSLREALHGLLREIEVDGPRERLAALAGFAPAALIALLYGLDGFEADAREWFGRAQRPDTRSPSVSESERVVALEVVRAALSYLGGDYVATIRSANLTLGRVCRREGDPYRSELIALLGHAYLRLGQIFKAEHCVKAILKSGPGPNFDLGWALGLLLQGEIHAWSIVRAAPGFRGQLLYVDEWGLKTVDAGARAEWARIAFETARDYCAGWQPLADAAQAGLVRIRLLFAPVQADWLWLEQHARRAEKAGIAHERDATQLNLAILSLLQRDAAPARRWLAPLQTQALARPGSPFELDVLYGAALAAEYSGDPRTALSCLSEYNARIRAQHLSRVMVPPPNLEPDAEERVLPDLRRRRGDEDGTLIAKVSALVREHPDAPTHSRQLAAMAGISRRTLEYTFRRATGKSPKEYVTGLRLQQAYEALAEPDLQGHLTLAQVARSTGFSNYRSFVRAFKRVYGINPSQALARVLEER